MQRLVHSHQRGNNMKVYKVTVYAYDHEGSGVSSILHEIKSSKYITVQTSKVEMKDIGEWQDDHPLNFLDTDLDAYWETI